LRPKTEGIGLPACCIANHELFRTLLNELKVLGCPHAGGTVAPVSYFDWTGFETSHVHGLTRPLVMIKTKGTVLDFQTEFPSSCVLVRFVMYQWVPTVG
jgi:hypothetical protein